MPVLFLQANQTFTQISDFFKTIPDILPRDDYFMENRYICRIKRTDMAENISLMARRIRRILLVCNNYDKFSLEEDGRIEGRIAAEYAELTLSNPPVFVRAESTREALSLAESGERFDLTITMYNVGEVDVFDFSRRMKKFDPDMPVVLLTSFSTEVYRQMEDKDRS